MGLGGRAGVALQVLVCQIPSLPLPPNSSHCCPTAVGAYSAVISPPRSRATAHAPVPGHVTPVMAASVARGGVSAGLLLRVAKGRWWSRSGGFWGSGEAASPATARKFRVTGTCGASGPGLGSTNPSDARRALRAAHPTVFSRLALGGGGRTERPRAARGRVSAGGGGRTPHSSSHEVFPAPTFPAASPLESPCAPSCFPALSLDSTGTRARVHAASASAFLCPQGERGVRRPVGPADPGERQSRG